MIVYVTISIFFRTFVCYTFRKVRELRLLIDFRLRQFMQRSIKIGWLLVLVTGLLLLSGEAKAQRLAVSTNGLEWLTLSPNASFDVAFTQHHTFSMSVSTQPWRLSQNFFMSHITISPEYRYWFRMPFYRSFVGANLTYSGYDLSLFGFDRKGELFAAGVTYGYSFLMGKRWNLVPFLGAGVGMELADKVSFIPVIARLGLNIQLVIK